MCCRLAWLFVIFFTTIRFNFFRKNVKFYTNFRLLQKLRSKLVADQSKLKQHERRKEKATVK